MVWQIFLKQIVQISKSVQGFRLYITGHACYFNSLCAMMDQITVSIWPVSIEEDKELFGALGSQEL